MEKEMDASAAVARVDVLTADWESVDLATLDRAMLAYAVTGDKTVFAGIGSFFTYLAAPIVFLSLAQSGGNVAGLNPVRVLKWLMRFFPAYLGVLCLAAVSLFGSVGLCVLLWKLIVPAFENSTTALRALIFVSLYILYVLIHFHPLAYFANLLGMLYRRYKDRLA